MKTLNNYNSIIAVIVKVLDLTSYFYARLTQEIAVQYHYAELEVLAGRKQETKHQIDPTRLILLVTQAVERISKSAEMICLVNQMDIETTINAKEDYSNLSEDFYWSLIYKSPEDTYRGVIDGRFLDQVHLYVSSMQGILRGLSEMLNTGEVEMEVWPPQSGRTVMLEAMRGDVIHLQVYAVLEQLHLELIMHQHDLYQHDERFITTS